jgi:hypothetical protein
MNKTLKTNNSKSNSSSSNIKQTQTTIKTITVSKISKTMGMITEIVSIMTIMVKVKINSSNTVIIKPLKTMGYRDSHQLVEEEVKFTSKTTRTKTIQLNNKICSIKLTILTAKAISNNSNKTGLVLMILLAMEPMISKVLNLQKITINLTLTMHIMVMIITMVVAAMEKLNLISHED